jgi:hypothetical protein
MWAVNATGCDAATAAVLLRDAASAMYTLPVLHMFFAHVGIVSALNDHCS